MSSRELFGKGEYASGSESAVLQVEALASASPNKKEDGLRLGKEPAAAAV